MGFNAPSKIQETALPTLLADPPQNMIAQSQSGTGKTASFVLAMLSRVDSANSFPQVLCLSPTYELALQTGEVASRMSQFAPELTIRYAVRGEEIPRNSKITDHIIIGTPGKVLDWSLKFRFFDLKKIKVFVLDEADVMIATQGHQDQSIRIQKNLSQDCQMMLFSATYGTDVMNFAENIVSDPVIIRLRREEESLDNIGQYWVQCETEELKYNAIANIYGVVTIGKTFMISVPNWFVSVRKRILCAYRISSYSFRGNYSFLSLEIQRSQYIRPKVTVHKCAETIQGRKLFKGGNYSRKYGMPIVSFCAQKQPNLTRIS